MRCEPTLSPALPCGPPDLLPKPSLNHQGETTRMAEIRTTPLMTLKLAVSGMQAVGETPSGNRRIGLVAGGTFEGPKLRGKVLPGGADWIIVRNDGVTTLDVRI